MLRTQIFSKKSLDVRKQNYKKKEKQEEDNAHFQNSTLPSYRINLIDKYCTVCAKNNNETVATCK